MAHEGFMKVNIDEELQMGRGNREVMRLTLEHLNLLPNPRCSNHQLVWSIQPDGEEIRSACEACNSYHQFHYLYLQNFVDQRGLIVPEPIGSMMRTVDAATL